MDIVKFIIYSLILYIILNVYAFFVKLILESIDITDNNINYIYYLLIFYTILYSIYYRCLLIDYFVNNK